MKCISVYTDSFSAFSDICEEVLSLRFSQDEEKVVEGIVVSESGQVPAHYVERMSGKPDVAVLKMKPAGITILQRGDRFEILIPEEENMIH